WWQRAACRVLERGAGFGGRQPLEDVDLLVRREIALDGPHHPVAHELEPALAVVIADPREIAHQLAEYAGLLLDLPQRPRFEALPRLELALRQRPVVVAR